jgi:hypothetical protein
MSYSKTRHLCLFSNRWVIYLFSLYGLFTGSIIAYVIALTFWVWLAEFTRIEVKCFKKITFAALLR